jgi:hypothetical protein
MEEQLYAKLYDAEWGRTDQLQNAVGTPMGILVLLGGALLVIAQQFKSDWALVQYTFWPLFLIACTSFSVAVYMAVRSYYGYVYSRIPFPSHLVTYYQGLRQHYAALGKPGLADSEFDLYLIQRYVEATDRNSVHNANRGVYIHKANRALVAAVIATAACAVPHTMALRSNAPEVQRIEIINHKEVALGTPQRSSTTTHSSAQARSAAQRGP